MLIGYARVSKADGSQVADLQHDALVRAGVSAKRIYEDRASGKRDDRPNLEACLKSLRQGDVLVVWKLDRLGRSLRHGVRQSSEQKVGLSFWSPSNDSPCGFPVACDNDDFQSFRPLHFCRRTPRVGTGIPAITGLMRWSCRPRIRSPGGVR